MSDVSTILDGGFAILTCLRYIIVPDSGRSAGSFVHRASLLAPVSVGSSSSHCLMMLFTQLVHVIFAA